MIPLKEAIEVKHRQAEQMPFNQQLLLGKLSVDDYVRYLWQQHGIFDAIERNYVLPHPSLRRSAAILDDIHELAGNQEIFYCNATVAYRTHLQSILPADIFPHIYLNYLAVMFGGQMMKKVVPGSGRFYEFENFKDAIQSIRAIQQDSWADEANRGLDYHIEIYNELYQLSGSSR